MVKRCDFSASVILIQGPYHQWKQWHLNLVYGHRHGNCLQGDSKPKPPSGISGVSARTLAFDLRKEFSITLHHFFSHHLLHDGTFRMRAGSWLFKISLKIHLLEVLSDSQRKKNACSYSSLFLMSQKTPLLNIPSNLKVLLVLITSLDLRWKVCNSNKEQEWGKACLTRTSSRLKK